MCYTQSMIEEKALAKLNLSLGVLYKRFDGYHAIDSIMQTVSLYDTLIIEKAHKVEVNVSGMTLPPDNTLTRTANAYKKLTGCGCNVRCQKRIPMEAGLGGGSSDAAALLRGLQKLHRMLDDKKLYNLALSIGADVPFLLRGGTARAEGVGELLTPFVSKKLHFVIAKPQEGVSTAKLYQALTLPRPRVQTLQVMRALATGDMDLLASSMQNALEPKAIEFVPRIAKIKEQLVELGAIKAQMTGSGSAVFGIFETEEKATLAHDALTGVDFKAVCCTM